MICRVTADNRGKMDRRFLGLQTKLEGYFRINPALEWVVWFQADSSAKTGIFMTRARAIIRPS